MSDVRVTSCFADFDQQNWFTGIAFTGAVLKLRSIDLWVIPREVAQENPRPPSILMKIDKLIVPHDRNMYAQF